MQLSYNEIVAITQGAVYIDRNGESIQFHRFTPEQEAVYEQSRFHPKQYATAGIRLWFQTDSKSLALKVENSDGSSRNYFAYDIIVNGVHMGSLKGEGDDCYGEHRGKFDLGDGIKEVCIHFPWSVCSMLKELSLDDGSFITPVKRKKKVLIYGDSITQGYDAMNPKNRYAAKLADIIQAEEINKAIGGEIFCPWLSDMKEDFVPDYITVAYGTNHWLRTTPEELRRDCDAFYGNLVKKYPNSKIFALTPIWRKDRTKETKFGYFEEIGEIIEEVVKKYSEITLISCRNFIPEDENLFRDLYLHPNDTGFEYYSEGIKKALQK